MYDNNKENDVGKGQAIYVQKEIVVKQVYSDVTFEEVTLLEMKLKGRDKLIIVLVYRSPSSTEENNIKLNKLIADIFRKCYTHILIVGDFNYKHINWNEMNSIKVVETIVY